MASEQCLEDWKELYRNGGGAGVCSVVRFFREKAHKQKSGTGKGPS